MTLRSDGEREEEKAAVFLMDDVIMGSRDNTISQKKGRRNAGEPPSL